MTDKPFGVNLTILPSINPPPYAEYRAAIIESGVPVVRPPDSTRPNTCRVPAAGIKVLHKCTSVRHAVKAQRLGVDASHRRVRMRRYPARTNSGLVLIPAAADRSRYR